MKLFLVADAGSPNGEDAFCRELAKRAPQKGHSIVDSLEACDAVVVNSLQPVPLEKAKAAGKKAVLRLIDSYAGAAPEDLARAKSLALSADLVLVPSRYLAGIVHDWGANGQVQHVPYAYDRVMAKQIALVTMRASRKAFDLVACGKVNDASYPGFDTLLSALARLRLDWHLNLIGDGPALPKLMDRAGQLLCADRVSFLPAMPHEKLMEFFRGAKAYIDPCALDGYPSAALYALSEGCPVIGARGGALPEVIRSGDNGLLFQPGDAAALSEAVVTLWSVRGMSLSLIAEGIKTVGSHSWDRTVDAAFAALEKIS